MPKRHTRQSIKAPLGAAVRALRAAHATLAVAESCTGGGLGYILTSVPGSSAFFVGGVIAYANEVKRELLGVPAKQLARHGAVSRAVANAMACGVRERLQATWGIGITGIAGPTGGSWRKPVGTVWIAVAGPDAKLTTKCYHFSGNRAEIRQAAIKSALEMLAACLAREKKMD
ncbi:MAG: CinA family protein [bacterium]|nr:CinA family protein [bacterium]